MGNYDTRVDAFEKKSLNSYCTIFALEFTFFEHPSLADYIFYFSLLSIEL